MKLFRLIGLLLMMSGLTTFWFYFNQEKEKIVEDKLASGEEKEVREEYFAILEIPRINLRRELFEIGDVNNNVDKNLFVIKESIFPGDNASNVIIAGHSGNGKNAYFKELYNIQQGDVVKLYYNDYVYTYEVRKMEIQDKTGTLYLSNDYLNMITLITCTQNDKKHQTIYYAKLENQEKNVKN